MDDYRGGSRWIESKLGKFRAAEKTSVGKQLKHNGALCLQV